MIPTQEALLLDLYRGRLTRRMFFKRALALGLSTSAATTMLASCDAPGPSPTTPVTPTGTSSIIWENESDTYQTFQYLRDKFNAFTPAIRVQQIPGPSSPIELSNGGPDMHDDLASKLKLKHGTPDVLSLDVEWISEFASNNWIVPLDDLWPARERANYLSVPLEAVKYNGKIWAAPLHTDAGILFYRKDIFPAAPQTWEELVGMARQAIASKKTRWGYVWQGAQYEGMLCDFIEVLSSYGGKIFDDVSDPKVPIINSDAARKALTEMVNWVGTISPPDIVKYQETEAGDKWLNGEAAFMRNWPNYIALSNDASQSKVAGKFDIAHLPAGTQPSQSCLGGWQLAINRYSKNQAAAWEFIKWMLQPDAQQYLAIKEGFPVTFEKIYTNNYFKLPESPYYNPFFNKLEPILNHAQFRPISSHYQEIANKIEKHIYRALLKLDSPATALQELQAELEIIIGQPG
jgi:multiple sugar transport system substrate-binding protein